MSKQTNILDIYPLSPMQQGLLFHTLYAPNAGLYVEQLVVRWTSLTPFDVKVFQEAWQQVIDRHPILRTAFVWEGRKQPLQVVLKRVQFHLEAQDWQNLPATKRAKQLEKVLHADRLQSFDLTKAPLIRFLLIQITANEYYLISTHHHIILDGWSARLILQEAFALYDSVKKGDTPQLPLPPPYREFIVWLRNQTPHQHQTEQFWKQHLEGFTSSPTSLLSGPLPMIDAGSETFREAMVQLSPHTTQALDAFVKKNRLTLNTLLQAAWAILLSRYNDTTDVLFGVVVSGRPPVLPGVEKIAGLFINTLPLRVQVKREAQLLPWLQALQALQATMRQFEQTPLVQIQAWSDLPAGAALFDTVLAFENLPGETSVGKTSHLTLHETRYLFRTHYPLTLVVDPGQKLSLRLAYETHHFNAARIDSLLVQLQTVLLDIVTNPDQRLADVSLLSETVRQDILGRWCGLSTDYPRRACIHDLFAEQARQTSEKVAIIAGEQSLTYSELDQRANQLAGYLRQIGISPEEKVAVCLRRSPEMIVALLAVLKAGGCYVPLDAESPRERLALILTELETRILLTREQLLPALPSFADRTICLDKDWDDVIATAVTPPNQYNSKISAENIAYVMYTSGSTGQPKGVEITHRGVVRLVKENHFAQLTSDEVFLQLAPISFDAATLEIWGPLLNGAKLVLAPDPFPTLLTDLPHILQRHQVTTLWLTAGLFHRLVDENCEGLRPLTQLLTGGDVLSVPHVKRVLQQLPACQLINGYGPTENTTFTTCFTIEAGQIEDSVPIGRPIANTKVYVLDSLLQPVPAGVSGELYIGGDGLARGYFKRPGLTAEKFIPHPYSTEPGARLYKTGDRVRFRPDGNLIFLGRTDFQVKIRGFRVEPEEIEIALHKHPDVREAVVVVHRESTGDKRLVAYLVPQPDAEPTTSELRRFLQESLPDYMLPAAFVLLDSFPLNQNGKVDRQLLPAPANVRPHLEAPYETPQTMLEQTIAQVWQEVLNLDSVGIHDNFFDLGANSLLMTQGFGRLKQLNLAISIVDLFKNPTVHTLAECIVQQEQEPAAPAVGQSRAELRQRQAQQRHQSQYAKTSPPNGTPNELSA